MAIKGTLDRGRNKRHMILKQMRKMTLMTALPSRCVCDGRNQSVWLPVSTRVRTLCLFTFFASLLAQVAHTDNRNAALAATYSNKRNLTISFQTIKKGQRSGISELSHMVAHNAAEWEALWRKHNAFRGHQPKLPVVDFNREIVIGVFLGTRTTGGYEVEIVNISRDDGMFAVSFMERTPPWNGMVIQSLTQPFHFVRV